jgi:hypothetical protein
MFGDVAFAQVPFAALGGNTFLASISESSSAAETSSYTFSLGGLISESAGAADSQTVTAAYSVAIAETASAAETTTVQARYFVAVSEAASAADIFTAVKTVNANVTGIQLYVLIGNALVWTVIDDSQNPNWQNINNTQTPGWNNLPS